MTRPIGRRRIRPRSMAADGKRLSRLWTA